MRAVFSKVRVYSRAYSGYNFFVLLLKTILCKQLINTLKLAKIIYIWILYLKYLELIWKPCAHTFSPTVISNCLRIQANRV
jgi:hypothetical protein